MKKALWVIGIVLLVWALGIQTHSVMSSYQERQAPVAPPHSTHDSMPGMQMPAQPPESMAHLATRVAFIIVLLALIVPLAMGRRWAAWALVLVWIADIAPRLLTDHRCWVAYDPTRHGCHLFMRSVVLGTIGVVLCATAAAGNKR